MFFCSTDFPTVFHDRIFIYLFFLSFFRPESLKTLTNPCSVLSEIKTEIKLQREDTKSRVEIVEKVSMTLYV
jgi:hypothetical protein